MILIRNIFRLKFGQAKPAIAAFNDVRALLKKSGKSSRLLTDLVGPSFYTLVHEMEFESLSALDKEMQEMMGSAEFRPRYERFVAFVESGSREIFNIVE